LGSFGGLPALDQLMEDTLTALRDAGAVLVDPVDIVTVPRLGAPEFEVLLYEFKDGINRYLAGRGATTKSHTLAELIEFNRANAAREMQWFGQETFEKAQAKGPLTEPTYRRALADCRRLARRKASMRRSGDTVSMPLSVPRAAPRGPPTW
jgi:amidase